MRVLCNRPVVLLASVIAAATAMPSMPIRAQVVLGLPDEPLATTQKLQPTAELKAAMRAIRKHVLESHTLITHRRMPRAAALTLKGELLRVVEPFAKGQQTAPPIREIMALVVTGAGEISEPKAPEDRFEGLGKLEAALERYAAQFDDPDWQPLR